MVANYMDAKRKQVKYYFESWQSTIYSVVVFGATMVVIFWASVFLYSSFYFTFMPQESITWPIHFQFKSCDNEPGICSNPRAVVPVLDPVHGSLIVRGQKYRVVVDLEMPESPVNQKIGMFLITMEMKNQDGRILRQSSRSSMLRYKSELLHIISTFVFAPMLLYGLQEEKQQVTIELFSQYEEDPISPLSEVHIELTSRHVELYSAQMRIHAMFSGLRYFMYHYPLSAATVGIGICMVFLSSVVILSWYQFSGPSLSPAQHVEGGVSFLNSNASPVTSCSATSVEGKSVKEDGDGGSVGVIKEEIKGEGEGVGKVCSDPTSGEKEKDEEEQQEKQDSPVDDKAEREVFEMVGSKVQVLSTEPQQLPIERSSISSEDDCMVRQRVQSVKE